MKTGWKGSYYERDSAPAQPVRVSADASGLRVDISGRQVIWPFSDIVQKTGFYPGEPVRLDRNDEIVIVDERAFLDELHAYAPQFGQTVRDPKAARLVVLIYASLLLMIVLPLAAVWLARGVIEDGIAAIVPASMEARLGETTVAQVSMTTRSCSSTPLQQSVDAIVTRLSSGLERNDYTYRVIVIDDPTVNAFAAPGGYVALYRGLVERTDSAEELAGVLAHEMQHVAQRHSLKGLIRAVGMLTLISLISGDASAIAAAAGELSSLSFQREDEEEADREGMRALQRARIDPAGMVSMYGKLAEASPEMKGALRYLSTHPQTADRVEKLRSMAGEARYAAAPLVTPLPWKQAKALCR